MQGARRPAHQYHPNCDIKDDNAGIAGVRLFWEEDAQFDPEYIYVVPDSEIIADAHERETTTLINGRDIIVLQDSNVNNILNNVLAAFDYYNSWEAALWEESAHKSVERIIDLALPVLENPMMLSDFDGKVLAMSSAYKDDDINDFWVEARTTGAVPAAVLGSPMKDPEGTIVSSWSDTPTVYLMPDGTKTIGTFISVDGEYVAGLALWEHEHPIHPGDRDLVKILCTVLASMLGREKSEVGLRSSAAIIGDLLAGVEIESDLLEGLELKCASPWQLLVINNPFRSDTIYKRGIVQRIRNHAIPCVSLIYDNNAVALVSESTAATLLDSIFGMRERQYYTAGLSLPFDDIRSVAVRYSQTLFALERAEGEPGIYNSEDSSFDYFLSLANTYGEKQGLLHPALAQLKRYDEEKHADLYETLYLYLLYERSILLGSQALHIHRNSFMYRLNKIKELLELDLDNPRLRAYLLLSFLLDKAQ